MDAIAIRRELKKYIDKIPESNLEIVRPVLSFLAEKQDDRLVIETNLTTSEKAIIRAGRKERKEHPENFTPWATIKAESSNKIKK